MNYLLDTHVCIWAIGKQSKLSGVVKSVLQDTNNSFWVSRISFFEIAIKKKIGKLPEFEAPIDQFITSVYKSGFKVLDLKDEHFATYDIIGFEETHKDPFDRYLLSAARFENLAIITKDEKFQLYSSTFNIVW